MTASKNLLSDLKKRDSNETDAKTTNLAPSDLSRQKSLTDPQPVINMPPKPPLELSKVAILKSQHSVTPLSPNINDLMNPFDGSKSPDQTVKTIPQEKLILDTWNGYIQFSNSELFVKGYPLCGKSDKLYNEVKDEFLNKNLLKLRQKPTASTDENNNFKGKTIFEYLDTIRRVHELFFIRFEPTESKTHRSMLNLSGSMIPHDTNELYSLTFTDCSNQSAHNNYHKIQIPNEKLSNFESFYLFALKKKEDNMHDRYFLDKFSIRLQRNRDLIMGVIIKKASESQMSVAPAPSLLNCTENVNKRKLDETSRLYPQVMSNRLIQNLPMHSIKKK